MPILLVSLLMMALVDLAACGGARTTPSGPTAPAGPGPLQVGGATHDRAA